MAASPTDVGLWLEYTYLLETDFICIAVFGPALRSIFNWRLMGGTAAPRTGVEQIWEMLIIGGAAARAVQLERGEGPELAHPGRSMGSR
jgi:hypothetical protein